MLTQREVMRLVCEHFATSPMSIVVSEIWGDGQSYAVFADLPSAIACRPERRWAFTVDAQSGELTQHNSDATATAKTLTAGLTRIAWNPYRPCDSAVTSSRIRLCPVCRGKLLPIQWGMPGPDTVAAYERGEVALGGCVIDFAPPFAVKACAACDWTLMIEHNVP